ncbi:beta-lactamase-like protein [Rhizophagus irregularis DAOM 181602=DAOM 197198]|nr:beta-lactamase-like protein [Rhizophagus irregularis DAOM 181602=DAOM 197198]
MRNLRRIQYDCEEAMSAFEGLQIKSSIYLPIDIRLTVNEAEFTELIYECLDIVNISINSQFVRTVMTEILPQILYWLILEKIR